MSTEVIPSTTIAIPTGGVKVTGIDVTDDSISIRLNTTIGPIIGVCDADCCSETWIEDIEAPALGFPCTLLGGYDLDMPDARDSEEGEPQEWIAFYGLRLHTSSGDIDIEYRNASNGYYGGSLVWSQTHYYGGVFEQQVPTDNWLPLDEWRRRKDGGDN